MVIEVNKTVAGTSKIVHRNLNPVWDDEFETKIDSPWCYILFRVINRELYGNKSIGNVAFDNIAFLFDCESIDNWFPIYHSSYGIRGYIHISISKKNLKKQLSSPKIFHQSVVNGVQENQYKYSIFVDELCKFLIRK